MKNLAFLAKKDKHNTFTKKDGTLNSHTYNAISVCTFRDNKIYHTFSEGRGRYAKYNSYAYYIEGLLQKLGYKYTEGNDAPRGGKTGDYIKVSSKAYNTLINIFKESDSK
tara:strand:- start:148 stop:477 length:330 start_codon:yes stop_codon:yes gene_type:complete